VLSYLLAYLHVHKNSDQDTEISKLPDKKKVTDILIHLVCHLVLCSVSAVTEHSADIVQCDLTHRCKKNVQIIILKTLKTQRGDKDKNA